MKHVITYLRHNALAAVALFVALGGTSYAAVAIPRNSVGTKQLRKGAVTPAKLSSGSFGGRIVDFVEIENNGVVAVSDPRGAKTEGWAYGSGGGLVVLPHKIPRGCFPLAGVASTLALTGQAPSVGAGINSDTTVTVAVNSTDPVTLTVICAN